MILGVTGGIGGGKTTVSRMFGKLGAGIIDADRVYHCLIRPGKPLYRKMVSGFGRRILKKDGAVDRKKLSGIVFESGEGLKKLNALTHDSVIREIERAIRLSRKKVIVVDAALLIESGFYKKTDKVIVVSASMDKKAARLKNSRGISRTEIMKRMRTQMPLRKKSSFADFVIDNNGSKQKTSRQVKKIWKTIRGESWR